MSTLFINIYNTNDTTFLKYLFGGCHSEIDYTKTTFEDFILTI